MSRQARVGLLVLAGVALFMAALFILAQQTFLLSGTFQMHSTFYNVAGLLPGASVQYQGVNVGRVEAIVLPSVPGGKIRVDMAVKNEVRPLIRYSTQAQIESDGLVGNMIITLVSGDAASDPLPEGGELPGIEPFSITTVTERALSSVERFNQAAESFELIMQDVRNGEGTIGRFLYDPALFNSLVQTADQTAVLMQRLGEDASRLVAIAQEVTVGVDSMFYRINNGSGSLALLLNDPGMYNALRSASDTLLTISNDIRSVTRNTEEMTAWGAVAAFRVAELTEAAKTNFLFKRYFEERGYQEQAPFEIREQAIRASHREIEEQRRVLYEWEQRLEAQQARIDAVLRRLEARGTPPDSLAPAAAPDSLRRP